jgi:allophanate hydrolase subunit 2
MSPSPPSASQVPPPEYQALDDVTLRVTDGVHARAALLEGVSFIVSPASDRRGVRLVPDDGARAEQLAAAGGDVVSEGVSLGTVQLPSSGEPIILGVDRTSTGGYKKIASVIGADSWMLGQLRPGARVRFARVTMEQARRFSTQLSSSSAAARW